MDSPDPCLVRQPVFGLTGALLGYEIRFRELETNEHALLSRFDNGTFDLMRSNQPAFISCTRRQLIENDLQAIDPSSAILLLPASVGSDPDVLEAVSRYCDSGGQIALDGLTDEIASSEQLLSLATWVRVSHSAIGPAIASRLRQEAARGIGDFTLMVHGIETTAQFQLAQQLGATAFQGVFFSSPEPLAAAELPGGTMSAVRLMGLARDPNVNDRKLEEVISIDPVLTFQLLRLVNSAAVGLRGVSSIGQALRAIGRNTFQRWLAVAVAASRKSSSAVDQELVRRAVERARFLEMLGGGPRDSGTLFLVGLFSMLDAVFRMPLPDLIDRVALSNEATAALLDRTGPYATALSFAESYEMGLFEHAALLAEDMNIDPSRIGGYYATAVGWTNEALAPMLETPDANAGNDARRMVGRR